MVDLDMNDTSTVIDQDYKVTVVKDAIKDNCDKLLDIGLMTMKVRTSNLISRGLRGVIRFDISTKLQVYV